MVIMTERELSVFNACSERYSVFYSDCLVDAELDVINDVFVRYERET